MKQESKEQAEPGTEANLKSTQACPGLEWVEAEWFKVWLQLARHGRDRGGN